ISSTAINSDRRIRATALVTVSSARWRRTRPPRSSRANQATLRPASTQSGLGGRRDRRRGRFPRLEGLAGREGGRGPAGSEAGAFPSGEFLAEQDSEDLGRFSPLRSGGGPDAL